jgi:YidC/Oxa1 family membrane protein insertase
LLDCSRANSLKSAERIGKTGHNQILPHFSSSSETLIGNPAIQQSSKRMSSPQQPPKQRVITQLLLFGAVYLAAMLMCNRQQPAETDTRTSAQILGDVQHPASGEPPVPKPGEVREMAKGTMYWAASNLDYNSLSAINSSYQKKVKDEADAQKKGLKDPALVKQIENSVTEKELAGDLLIAETAYRYSLTRNDTGVMRNSAYNALQKWERKLQGNPLWTQRFPMPAADKAPARFPWSTAVAVPSGGQVLPAGKVDPLVLPEAKWVADQPAAYRFPPVEPSGTAGPGEESAKDLYERLVADISGRNRSELTYGVFPGYQIIDFLVNLTGANPSFSYAFAAFLLALCVRAIIYPLAQKQLMWGRKMQQLAPLVKEIKEQYTDKKTKQSTNPAEMQQKTMALYAEYGINPLAGCLPAFVQFPLFITVYQFMLHYQFQFRNGYFLWINPGTSQATNGFFAPNLSLVDHTLIVIYGITMVTSTLLMPVSDPTQVKQQRIMGVGMGLLMTFFMFTGAFPVPGGFVLYWTFTNLLATAQSLRAYRLPMPPLEKVNTKTGGVFPMPPFSPNQTNGKTNGTVITPKTATGTPAKHRPKKRK